MWDWFRRPQERFLDADHRPRIEWSEYREPRQFVADPFLVPAGEETRLLRKSSSITVSADALSKCEEAATESFRR